MSSHMCVNVCENVFDVHKHKCLWTSSVVRDQTAVPSVLSCLFYVSHTCLACGGKLLRPQVPEPEL